VNQRESWPVVRGGAARSFKFIPPHSTRDSVRHFDNEIMVWRDDEPLRPRRDLLAEAGVDSSPWASFVVTAWTPDKRVLVGVLQKTSPADQVPFYLLLPKGTL